MNNAPSSPPTQNSEEEVASFNTILIQTLVAIVALGVIVTLLTKYYEEPIRNLSEWFIGKTGHWGVALGFFLPDSMTLPLPPDAFLYAGLAGKLGFWLTALSASVGSILGGITGFLAIRKIVNLPSIHRRISKKLSRGQALMDAYGVKALALAALTPLPYSIVCWACGAMGMRFSTFFLVSLLRIPRICLYLYGMQMIGVQG